MDNPWAKTLSNLKVLPFRAWPQFIPAQPHTTEALNFFTNLKSTSLRRLTLEQDWKLQQKTQQGRVDDRKLLETLAYIRMRAFWPRISPYDSQISSSVPKVVHQAPTYFLCSRNSLTNSLLELWYPLKLLIIPLIRYLHPSTHLRCSLAPQPIVHVQIYKKITCMVRCALRHNLWDLWAILKVLKSPIIKNFRPFIFLGVSRIYLVALI
jgi:hypothetical protein